MNSDRIQTLANACKTEMVVQGSKFIAQATPSSDPGTAETYIESVAKTYHDATHNCYAYTIGAGSKAISRFSDAGEPSGTAGRPILQAIEMKDLSNVTVVVTRYFGGTRLGRGGLARAYRDATIAVLDLATVKVYYAQSRLQIRFPYRNINTVHRLIDKYHARVLRSDFGDLQTYLIQLNSVDAERFSDDLIHGLKGNITLETIA